MADSVGMVPYKDDVRANPDKYVRVNPAGDGFVYDVPAVVVWKDASEQAMLDTNRTATLDWTDLDLTAFTSVDAKLAILNLRMVMDSIDGVAAAGLQVRKNGTTPDYFPTIMITEKEGNVAGATLIQEVLLGMDAGQVIEYKIIIAGTIQVDSMIRVLGYIE